MRKKKEDVDELLKDGTNELCLKCIKTCKQPKRIKIHKCAYQPKDEK